MAFFDDDYLFTEDLPARITLERNRGRRFTKRTTETSWYLWPLELFVGTGTFFSGIARRLKRGEPLWDTVTFEKDGTVLLETSGGDELTIQADDILLVAGERGLNPSAAKEGEVFSLLGWKYVEFVSKKSSHQVTMSPEACSRVYTLGVQTNPYVVGVDASHQIYLPEALKQNESAKQRDALLEAARRILTGRATRTARRAIFALIGAGLFGFATYAWLEARWRPRGFFFVLPVAGLGALALFCSSVADGWDIKKRVTMLSQ